VSKDKEEKPEKIDVNVPRTREQDRAALRRKVEIFYDLQRLRLQTGGRTYARADGTAIQLHEVDVAILEQRMKELERAEKNALADVAAHLRTIRFYNETLSDKVRYRGIGPTMAGVILSAFDIHREATVSQMWAFAGLRPMPARRCKACHTVVELSEREGVGGHRGAASVVGIYKHTRAATFKKAGEVIEDKKPTCKLTTLTEEDTYASGKAQRPIKGEKLNYNAFLRTKLVGVLGPVLIKCGSPWRKFYDDYKHRKESAGWGRNDGHRHQAAIRYMIKMLLLDIYVGWRTCEGLPVREPYAEQYLGHKHSGGGAATNGAPAPRGDDDPNAGEIAAELDQLA
jgi:hypothetical protein